jgi:Glyoxalase-like domain
VPWLLLREIRHPDDRCACYPPQVAAVIKSVTFDAQDALALATFWAAVPGSDVDEDSTTGKAFVEAAGWGGPNIWFIQVPEGKNGKNRMHFDLRAPGTVAAEVARLRQLGATVMADHGAHVVMADPEGNEFCVEPGPAPGQ